MNFSLHVSDSRCKKQTSEAASIYLFSATSPALEMGLLSTHPADSYIVWLCCWLLQSLSETARSSPAPDLYLLARCHSAPEIKGGKSWLNAATAVNAAEHRSPWRDLCSDNCEHKQGILMCRAAPAPSPATSPALGSGWACNEQP